jgi:hypothetical protein
MASVGWCPIGSSTYGSAELCGTCDVAYTDAFCQKNYGGQLIALEDQADYDRIPNDGTAADEKYMTGRYSDGQGRWKFTDGTPPT